MSSNFFIYAGTHKAATSSIGHFLKKNVDIFEKSNIFVYKDNENNIYNHKKLISKYFHKQAWRELETLLKNIKKKHTNALLCSDNLYKKIFNYTHLIENIWANAGWNLHLIFGLRDQPDFINSMYCHSIRRGYHNMYFKEYVEKNINDKKFNYNYLFKKLIDTKINNTFIPFTVDLNIFDVLIDITGWSLNLDKNIARKNEQIGKQGINLAIQLYNLSKNKEENCELIRKVAIKNGWHLDRYFGFDQDSYLKTRAYFKQDNDEFAKKVWNCEWIDKFPTQKVFKNIYET